MDVSQPIHAALSDLKTKGWQVGVSSDGWLLQREGHALYASLNARWLYFSLPVPQTQPAAHYLQASRRLYVCKYGRDPHGQLLLQAELPLADLERTYIHLSVEALWRAVQQHDSPMPSPVESTPIDQTIEYFPRYALDTYFKGLRHEGWGLRKAISLNEYRLHCKTPERPFEVYLAFNAAWAYWQVPILEGELAARWWLSPERESLCRYLLAVNEQLYWARFGVDEGGNVLLLLDVPLSLLTAERFRLSAQAVAQYAADYAYEVLIMAELNRDEALARLLAAEPREKLEFHN